MPLAILDAISLKGDGTHNEDIYGAEGGFAWVLDGATGVAASSIAEETSDAGWYVERVSAELRSIIRKQPDIETRPLLQTAIRAVWRDYQTAIAYQEEPLFPPSAAFALLRINGDKAEFSALGDCAVLYTAKDGTTGLFEGDLEKPIDAKSLQHLVAEQAKTPDAKHEEIIDRLKPLLRTNRARMNTPEGYWILSFSENALDHMHVRQVEIDPSRPVMLMSDGFTRALQMLDDMDGARLYQAVLSEGAACIGDHLRRREDEDASCRLHPRFKKCDDATCLVVSPQ